MENSIESIMKKNMLIPSSKVDFHSHIIPGIDDGSKSFAMTIAMLETSNDEEIKYIAATSHFILGESKYSREEYDLILKEVQKNTNGINIVSGMEVYINPDLNELYKKDRIWTINNSRYMLIELPMNDFPIYTENVFYELGINGIVPILAHPERNRAIMKDETLLESLIEQGAMAQMNTGSLTGEFGRTVKEFAERLVKRNLIHITGSDAHNDNHRTTSVEEGRNSLKKINPDLFTWIEENEEKIIFDEKIQCLDICDYKERRFFNFFKGKGRR